MTAQAPASRVPPYVLVVGPEVVLTERAIGDTVEALLDRDSDPGVIQPYPEECE